jgi:hypothetical protein
VQPHEEAGLLPWVRSTVSAFQGRWLSPRGFMITATLDRYLNQGRIKFNVVVSATNAVWTKDGGGRIYIYVEQNARNAALFRNSLRRYSPANPGGWLVSADNHYLPRTNLVVNLAHEGLHACLAFDGEGSLDEELDARLAANAAATAVGVAVPGDLGAIPLPQSVGRTYAGSIDLLRKDYPTLKQNPAYVPLCGIWPTPWRGAF